MDFDHDLVIVDEFDALAIEVKVPPKHGDSSSAPAGLTAADKEKARLKQQLNDAWLNEKIGKFPAKTHAQKVAKELGVQNGLIFLPGQTEKLYEYSDMGPGFRQRRHFYYLSGADFPGCAVTYDIARDILILWIPYTDPRSALWYGTTPSIEECKAAYAVDDVRHAAGLERFFSRTLSPGSTLFVLDPDQTPKLTNTKGVVHIDTAKLRPAIEAARVIKTDYEVAMIRRANAVSSAAHKVVLCRLKKLTNEREIEAIFRGFCLAQGAKRQSYPVIAGSGPNAGTLHYDANNEPLAGRQVVVLDAGAEWRCYASDITRTIPVGGKFGPEAQAIYLVVERMQNECIQRIKPGVVYYTLHLHACIVAVTELLRLGILHGGTAAEIFNKGTVAAFFPHGLGHHVGLEVHDVSGHEKLIVGWSVGSSAATNNRPGPSKREWMSPEMLSIMYRDAVTVRPPYKSRQTLAKNMVVTVEPGIYFCREYIKAYFLDNPLHAKYINTKVLDKYYDVGGVRIEDCILVTEDGYENLTTAPKGEEMIRVINASG
ncbi:peptidase M24, structural domain-containing protein [Apodospora peruviana]|uniref:Xaa-Pro aminopeptidase n=1 Tax=Apodospora peruviana TaxID=516989 RepID=A0AAE0LZQ8_9PEZI|nr:peptidase M24, structural domain-containing protein [Apodospora peruviana]